MPDCSMGTEEIWESVCIIVNFRYECTYNVSMTGVALLGR